MQHATTTTKISAPPAHPRENMKLAARSARQKLLSHTYCIELGAAFVIIYGTAQGWPLSTTHCQIGATVAVGLFEGVGGVNCKLFAKTCFGATAASSSCEMAPWIS